MKFKYLYWTILIILSFLLIECGKDPIKADFERVEDLYKKEKYKAAAEKFRDLATLNPQSEWAPKALYRSGTIYYLYLKDYDEAVEDFAYLIYYYPKNKLSFDAQVDIVEIYMNKLKDYPQARVEIQRLLEHYPNKDGMDQYQYMLAQCFYNMRDFDQTRLEYLILLDSYPNSDLRPQVYYDIANTYFIEGSGKLDKAIEYYQKVIDEYPESDLINECNFYIAASLEEKGELYEALGAVGKDGEYLFTIDPDNFYKREFPKILKAAGVRRIRFHDLRHTFAALMISQGENPKFLQRVLGHESFKTTMDTYGHLFPDEHQGAGRRLETRVLTSKLLQKKEGKKNQAEESSP